MEIPDKLKSIGLEEYYSGLEDPDRLRISRYLPKIGAEDAFHFFCEIVDLALADDNPKFAVKMCVDAYVVELDDIQEFQIVERLIQAYFACKRYDDTKDACERNLELFEQDKDAIIRLYAGNIDNFYFRNRYIDVIVGVESNYDLAEKMLVKYNQLGILSDEDLESRRNSLKIHRLQKVFDGLYTYRPKGE